MFQLELNDQERAILSDVLSSFLSELHTEVSHTDRREYRDRLRDQEHLIRSIQGKLDRPPA